MKKDSVLLFWFPIDLCCLLIHDENLMIPLNGLIFYAQIVGWFTIWWLTEGFSPWDWFPPTKYQTVNVTQGIFHSQYPSKKSHLENIPE